MKYQFEETRMQSVEIPTRVVDGLLGIATGAQLKVLLYLMRFDKLAHEVTEIAASCNIDPADVEPAIDFWVKENIFVKEGGKLRLVNTVKTVQTREMPRIQATIILDETDKSFQDTVAEIQRITGKTVSSMLISLFYNMRENLRFSSEMILQLVAYCNSIDKFSYRYMEAVAADWFDNGIDSFDKAEAHISKLEYARSLENRLAKAFGITTAFSKKQREQIAQWAAWGLNEELIVEAYDRCMDRKGQMSFAYMHKILEDWHSKGYQRAKDIQDQKPEDTGRKPHQGLTELERKMIEKMQAGGDNR